MTNVFADEYKLKTICGSPSYMAPEMFQNSGYDGPSVDVWACGVVLYAMLIGNFPFNGSTPQELIN